MRPTLFSPPKAFSFDSLLSTITGSGPASASRVPARAVEEGRLEHREEVAVRDADQRPERLATGFLGIQDPLGLEHHQAPRGDVRGFQRSRIAVGELLRRHFGLLFVGRLLGIPAVDRDRVEPVALPRDRVGRHRVVDREGDRADGDAERHGQHHQGRKPGVAFQAEECESQVIGEHGVLRRQARACASSCTGDVRAPRTA